MDQLPKSDSPSLQRNPNPHPVRTLFKAMALILMFAIAVTGLIYTAHMIWTMPAKP